MLKYINPKNLMTEVHRYGYNFSLANYVKYLLFIFIGVGAVGYLLGLRIPFVLILLGTFLFFLPTVILTKYRSMFEQKKFSDVTNYIEQLLYSFKRRAKILNALQDTLALYQEGELMYECIEKAIHYINTAVTEGNLYEEAFQFIEEEYGCSRVRTVHKFLVKAESIGGRFEQSIDILLNDRKLWIDRVYETEKDKDGVKRNVTIAIILSFVIIGMTLLWMPENMGGAITSNMASQIVTTLSIIANIAIWVFVQNEMTGSLLRDEKEVQFSSLKKYYDRAMNGISKKDKTKSMVMAVILVPIIAICYFTMDSLPLVGVLLALLYLIATNSKRKYKFAVKRITREVEKAFPEWMMSMALALQTDNVHVSLSKTIDSAPEILQEELRRLLQGVMDNPNKLDPYVSFMEQLDIPDVKSAMKMFYSMVEYGATDIGDQIGTLIERNTVLMDKAERLRKEDYLAGMGMMVLLPMFTGVAKMCVDMFLVIGNLLTMVNKF